jgi:biopolymer transport protein ExbB
MIEKFLSGGIFMWPILFCTLVGIAISIERFQVLMRAGSINKDHLLSILKSKMMKGDVSAAINIIRQKRIPITNIVYAGLNSAVNNGSPEEIQTSMDAAALREIPSLEKRIMLINTCANIATLLGLLGTVAGLISAFDAVANVSPDKKAEMLASAIATAMNTTAAGLIGAIPLLGLYGYLSSKSDELVSEIHESSVSTLNFIISNKNRIKAK